MRPARRPRSDFGPILVEIRRPLPASRSVQRIRTSSRFHTACLCLVAALACWLPSSVHAQPELAAGPTTEQLQVPGAKLNFIFSEAMNQAEIHIAWAGAGIDPARFSYQWMTFGLPIPALMLEATYAGGLPGGIEVTYTLNPGNSGRMKSVLGEPLPETTGTFRTPTGGTGGGDDCDPDEGDDGFNASVVAFKEIHYRQTGDTAPVFDPVEGATFFAAVFEGTNSPAFQPTSATLVRPDGSTVALTSFEFEFEIPDIPGFPIPELPKTFYLSTAEPPEIAPPHFDSEDALNAAYPNGTYRMTIGLASGGPLEVQLPLSPAADLPVPRVSNFASLQSFDPAVPLTLQWQALTGAGPRHGISLHIAEKDGMTVFQAPDNCEGIELPATATSIIIPAGTFQADRTYEVELSFQLLVHEGFHAGAGFTEFTGLDRTTRLYIGAPNEAAENTAVISSVRLDPAGGIVVLTIEGTLASPILPTLVEATTDFVDWTPISTFSKAILEASGGVLEVPDPAPAVPYKFYRLHYP